MKICYLCKKRAKPGSGSFFRIPRDDRKEKWVQACGLNLPPQAYICKDHFAASCFVRTGPRLVLLPNAVPLAPICNPIAQPVQPFDMGPQFKTGQKNVNCSSTRRVYDTSGPRFYANELRYNVEGTQFYKIKRCINVTASKDPECEIIEIKEEDCVPNELISDRNVIPPQLQEEPIVHIPFEKPYCERTTQTNGRLCGLVETSDFADEFRFNCFYCSEIFPMKYWKVFINHLKKKHFEVEEAFKTSKYISEDHDYTPVSLPLSTKAETTLEMVFNDQSIKPNLADPLAITQNSYKLENVKSSNNSSTTYKHNTTFNYKEFSNKIFKAETSLTPVSTQASKSSFLNNYSQGKLTKRMVLKKNLSKLMHSRKLHLGRFKRQTSKVSALSRCLKRTNVGEIVEPQESDDYESDSVESVKERPEEIAFANTSPEIVNFLIDNMKSYPVLWQFDEEPFNEDFFEAVEDICKLINKKWSLSIDNLKMRRSINRILRFYCSLFPNANVGNTEKFTCYYDRLSTFLPSSINEIAYARCSHCYVCYKSDFDLQLHLSEEHKYLQWPYKCIQCKECFIDNYEFDLHKVLPHYDEVFRCVPCNKSFFRCDAYKKHLVDHHSNDGNGQSSFKCNICDKTFESASILRTHKNSHGEKQFKCDLCPKAFFENSKLKLHLKIHRKEYDFVCEVCGKEFYTAAALSVHMKKHTGEKVTCNICSLRLRKSSLGRHLRIVHVVQEGIVEPLVNGKKIRRRRRIMSASSYSIHKRHGEKRNYYCKTCNINLENYKLIVEHNKELHSDIPKWPCRMCTSEFNLKLNLKRHYRRKHKLHIFQVYKLVEENEDLNTVLAMETEQIDTLVDAENSKNSEKSTTKSNIKSPLKTELLPDDIYYEEEKICSSEIQDEIMKAVDDVETQTIEIDYMNEIFSDY